VIGSTMVPFGHSNIHWSARPWPISRWHRRRHRRRGWITTSYLIAEIIVIPLSGWLASVFLAARYF